MIVDNAQGPAFGAETEHGFDEVATSSANAGRAKDTGSTEDEGRVAISLGIELTR